MKKFKFIIIFSIIFVLTGCSSQSLSCTKTEDTDYGKISESQSFSFSNNKITLYSAEMSIKLNDDFNDYADVLLESLEEPFKDYKNKDGIEYETSKKDDVISIKFSGDYDKMDDETKDSLGIDKKSSYDEVKKSLEDDDYTCK